MAIDRIAPTRRPSGRVVMRQDWHDLLFLHWAVPPNALQKLLPPGLCVDMFGGAAYVGLVPFTMRNVRPIWSPPVPWLSHFHECNVRTYVYDVRERVPGVWFFSLDAANPVAVALARGLWKLPYFRAQMRLIRQENGQIDYQTRRTGPLPLPVSRKRESADCAVTYAPTGTPRDAEPGTREFFLAERYVLYAQGKSGRLLRGQVHHTPYPLQSATVHHLNESLVKAAGITLPPDAPSPIAHYAHHVSVDVFGLETVSGIEEPKNGQNAV